MVSKPSEGAEENKMYYEYVRFSNIAGKIEAKGVDIVNMHFIA